MKMIHISNTETIYMDYGKAITFDQPITQKVVEATLSNITYDIDEAFNRTTFSAEFENYTIRGYLHSSKVTIDGGQRYLTEAANDFIKKVEECTM